MNLPEYYWGNSILVGIIRRRVLTASGIPTTTPRTLRTSKRAGVKEPTTHPSLQNVLLVETSRVVPNIRHLHPSSTLQGSLGGADRSVFCLDHSRDTPPPPPQFLSAQFTRALYDVVTVPTHPPFTSAFADNTFPHKTYPPFSTYTPSIIAFSLP